MSTVTVTHFRTAFGPKTCQIRVTALPSSQPAHSVHF